MSKTFKTYYYATTDHRTGELVKHTTGATYPADTPLKKVREYIAEKHQRAPDAVHFLSESVGEVY